jgi:hypothetical protein
MTLSPKNDFLIAGCKNGEVLIWSMEMDKKVLKMKMHDGVRGAITGAFLNRR